MGKFQTELKTFLYSSIFGALTRNVQVRFDKVSELNKKLFDNVIFGVMDISCAILE